MLQWHKLEVCELHRRPDHPVFLQCREVRILQLLRWISALHNGHAAQEAEQIGTSEHRLICEDSRDDLQVWFAWDDDLSLQKREPHRGCWTKDTSTIQRHAACSCPLLILNAFLFNSLLGHGVTGREEDGGRDRLGEERARSQLGLVPDSRRQLTSLASSC